MANTLFNWLLDIVYKISEFGTWLTTSKTYEFLGQSLTFTPLTIFSFGTLTTIIGLHVIHLIWVNG